MNLTALFLFSMVQYIALSESGKKTISVDDPNWIYVMPTVYEIALIEPDGSLASAVETSGKKGRKLVRVSFGVVTADGIYHTEEFDAAWLQPETPAWCKDQPFL